MNPKIKRYIDQLRLKAALAVDPGMAQQVQHVQIPGEKIHINGHIRAREVPFETEEEWRHWWLGEFQIIDGVRIMIRPPRMSEKEKDRYTVAESENMIVLGGVNQILAYLGSQNGRTVGFAQYFAFGSTPLGMVNFTDTDLGVGGEWFRIAPSMSTVSGIQVDLDAFYTGAGFPIDITVAGLYGVGATSTPGSGTLMTKSMLTYTQGASAHISYDYLLSYA